MNHPRVPVAVRAVRSVVLSALALMLLSGSALASVRLEGAWPDVDRPVSLEASGLSRAEAIRKLASSMGWSVVLHAPSTDPVDLQIADQPAGKVLEVLLADGAYVAKRDGKLVSITRQAPLAGGPVAEAPAPEASGAPGVPVDAAAPPAEPEMPKEGDGADRVVTGGNVRVEKHEVVHDVVVFGGSADVLGTATGDVAVVGGAVRVHEGAHVMGDATAVGGSLTIEDGARVDGDVGVVGGTLHRGDKARIGRLARIGRPADERHAQGTEGANADEDGEESSWLVEAGRDIASAIRNSALLFVFGAVLLALAGRRVETLAVEVAARPMRSLALGVVGALGVVLLSLALVVTLIGIPVAVVGGILALVSTYAGVCAVLMVAGHALLRHRTANPYVHLALGCGVFLVVGAVPYVGGVATFVVVLMGIGSLVATRGAGLFPPRRKRAPGTAG